METAPRDGSRILVQGVVLLSTMFYREPRPHPEYGYFYAAGWTWQECWFDGEKWQPWSGNLRTKSSGALLDNEHYVRAWAHTPFDPTRKVEPILVDVTPLRAEQP